MICFIDSSDGTENCHIYEKLYGEWHNRGLFSVGKCEMIRRAIHDAIIMEKTPIVEAPEHLVALRERLKS